MPEPIAALLRTGCRWRYLPRGFSAAFGKSQSSPPLNCDAGGQIRLAVCGIMSLEWKAFSNVSGAKSYAWRLSS